MRRGALAGAGRWIEERRGWWDDQPAGSEEGNAVSHLSLHPPSEGATPLVAYLQNAFFIWAIRPTFGFSLR